MAKQTVAVVHSREDQLLADLVSERLRRFTIVDRSRFFTDTVTQILDEQGYGRNHPDWRQHKSAICSILGSRGGRKKPKTSRKAVLAGKAGELFATGAMVSLAPVVTPLPVLPKYRPPTTPLWPAITDDMTPEAREAAKRRRSSLWNDMMYTARLRRDSLAREADGD